MHIPQLEIESGTSKMNISFAKTTNTKVFIKSAASQIVFKIPTEVQAEIKTDSVVENIKVDEDRFKKEGKTYKTSGFESASQRLQIEIVGSASKLEVR